MSTISGLATLEDTTLFNMWITRMEGAHIGEIFLPTEKVNKMTFGWGQHGRIGGATGQVSENEPGDMIIDEFSLQSSRVRHYRERTGVSYYLLQAGLTITSVYDKQIKLLKDRAAHRLEILRLNAIQNGGPQHTDAKGKYYKNLSDTNSEWVGGSGVINIKRDLGEAKMRINKYTQNPPDSLLVSPEAHLEMLEYQSLWTDRGPLSVDLWVNGAWKKTPVKGSVGRFLGFDVFVSTAVVNENLDDPRSLHVPIISNNAYAFSRGADLGVVHTYEDISLVTKRDDFTRMEEIQINFSAIANLYRPWHIYTLKNVIAP
jgi:hypothetical protein